MNAQSDLTWFFQFSASQLGLQSSFESVRNAIMNGGASKTSKQDNMSDRRMQAAERHRHINLRLHAVPPALQSILAAVYQSRRWPPQLESEFGLCLGAVPFTRSANGWFEEETKGRTDDSSFMVWLEGVVLRDERDRINRMRGEANKLLEKAHKAYSA